MPLYLFVRRYFFILLLLLLAGNLFVYRLMHQNNSSLINKHAPLGIISLEIAATTERISNIIAAWHNTPVTYTGGSDGPEHLTPYTALDVAKRQTKFDFFFLLFYSLLFALLLVRLAPEKQREKWIRLAVLLSLAAGLLDCVENCCMLKAMDHQPVAPWTIWLPSGIKWLLVFLLASTIIYHGSRMINFAIQRNYLRKQPQSE